jgi:signal transduction histidine kinase
LFGLGWALTTAQRRAGLLAREMTRELRAAEAAARRASRAKSEFLANMSHELRTPLNSVIGFANLLLKNKSGNLQTDDLTRLERIKANGFHLLTLVNDVLDLSRVEAGRMPLLLSDVNLDILVLETISEMESRISEKKEIRLLTDLPSRLAAFRTDERKFKQVLINLMNNALKFTEQGSITIGVVADAATARPTGLEVRDTGIGIPAEKREVIFEAFQQADNTTARQFGGSGLGLTITAALLKLMGHRLELDSEVGRGSTFRIVFGTPEDETPAPEARTVSPSSADNSAKDRTAQ